MVVLSFGTVSPRISKDCFVAENATLVGDIIVDSESSIWFNVSIRAERGPVKIGRRSNIQDNCVVHLDAGGECIIGDGVSVGHSAVIHGAVVGENSLVGMGAILLNGAKIGRNCVVGAGSLVIQNAEFPEGSLILGTPASVKRKLTQEEIRAVTENAASYNELRKEYLAISRKSG